VRRKKKGKKKAKKKKSKKKKKQKKKKEKKGRMEHTIFRHKAEEIKLSMWIKVR
jgi:hypothetical protein